MKRVVCLLCLCALILSCAGCAASNPPEETMQPTIETTEAPMETTVTTVPTEPEPKEMTGEELAEYSATRVVRIDTDRGHGTGFFIDDEGTLLTNYHVIEGAEEIRVHFDNNTEVNVISIVDLSPYYDIAMLKEDISGNDYFEIADDADQYKQGKVVYTRGYPLDLEYANFNEGKITMTSRKRGLMECITFDAAVSAGNSGGPIMNTYGQAIGIATAVLLDAESINFGIKLSDLDHLDMDKDFTINQYREWYNRETGRSYMSTEDGKTFGYTYVHTYQSVTGKACLLSTDDFEEFEEGYSIMYAFYVYEYDEESYIKYCDYLNEIGFEFDEKTREMGIEGVSYVDNFNGYEVAILIDTVNNWLIVSCPIE